MASLHKLREREIVQAAVEAAVSDPFDVSVAQVGKYRPRLKSAANRLVSDVTSNEMAVMVGAAKQVWGKKVHQDRTFPTRFPLSSQDVTSPRMTRIGLKGPGGTPEPQPGDKAFSDVWWISQEVDKDLRAAQLRQQTIANLLEEATRLDSSGVSELAIQEARHVVQRSATSSNKRSKRSSEQKPRSQSQQEQRAAGGSTELGIPKTDAVQYRLKGVDRPHTRCSTKHNDGMFDGNGHGPDEDWTGLVSRGGLRPQASDGMISTLEDDDKKAGSTGIRGAIGRKGKYVPHFRMHGRPKTAAQPVRDGWGIGALVFPQKKNGSVKQDPVETVYDDWQKISWADAKKYHIRRTDIRSAHFNRLRYGVKVQEELPPPPELAISGSHSIDPSTAAPPSWVRKGLSRDNNNAQFWASVNPENVERHAGQPATSLPFRGTGSSWIQPDTENGQSGAGEISGKVGNIVLDLGLNGNGVPFDKTDGKAALSSLAFTSKMEALQRLRNEPALESYARSSSHVRSAKTPAQLNCENRKFHRAFPGVHDPETGSVVVPPKFQAQHNSSSVFGMRDDDMKERLPAGQYKLDRQPYKIKTTQPAKAPFAKDDWPLQHRNNTWTNDQIVYTNKTLLPERQKPKKIVFMRDQLRAAMNQHQVVSQEVSEVA